LAQERFEGAAKMTKNDKKWQTCQKTSQKSTQLARMTHQHGPEPPHVWLEDSDFCHFFAILPKIIYLRKPGAACAPNFKLLTELEATM